MKIRLFHLNTLRGVVLPLALLVWWEVESHRDAAHAYTFVPLESVASAAIDAIRSGELLFNWWASLLRTSTGFLIGTGLGLTLGALMNFSRWVEVLVGPLYHAIRQVPLLGWIPLISLWFGNGEDSKLFVIALAAFYPTTLNTYEGLRNVDEKYLAVAQVLKLSRWQQFWHVTFPHALPSVFAGLLQATAFAWLSSIGGEFFFNPGPGLGTMMVNGQTSMQTEVVMVAVITITLTGFAMNALLIRLSRYSLRWRSTT
jgi:sulfonate transport system permease protein